jgi:hypothetical protein
VGGVAYHAGKSSANRSAAEAQQNERLAELEQEQAAAYPRSQAEAPAPPSAQPPPQDRVAQLEKLANLRSSGVLTAEEFEREKQRILQSQ